MKRLDNDHRLHVATQLLAGLLAGKQQSEISDKQMIIRAVRMADLLAEACVQMPVETAEAPHRPHLAVTPA